MNAFSRVIGYDTIKRELMRTADVLKNAEAYSKLGASAPNGLLLYGEPGVGKSLMAACLIEASGRQAFICRKDKPGEEFVKSIKETFRAAVEAAPSIVFLDDLDKFSSAELDFTNPEEPVVVQSCIDEVRGRGVFVLATANDRSLLPESLLRCGRFDRVIGVGVPRGGDAKKIIEYYLSTKTCAEGLDPENVARIMDGRSCAVLETAINKAALIAGFERAHKISERHLLLGCLDAACGVSFDSIYRESEHSEQSRVVACHEAGHIVVAETLNCGSVAAACLYGSGDEPSGFEKTTPMDYPSALPIENEIMIALGGYAAVKSRFGVDGVGASRDLQNAWDGTASLIEEEGICGFGFVPRSFSASEEKNARKERMAALKLSEYLGRVKEMLRENADFHRRAEEALLDRGFLTARDIESIRA